MKSLSNSVAGLGLTADPAAVAAATAERGASGRSSRDMARQATGVILTASETAARAADAAAQAEKDRVAAARATAAKAKADARAKALAAAHRWVKPLFSSYTLTSGFGWRWGRMHPAQDLAVPIGTPVHALSSGTVVFSGWSTEGYGYMVKIRYWDGTVSWMAHNSRLIVSVGEKVVPGQVVSYSGSTGNSTGPHVHLEIHPDDGAAVAPRTWLANHGVYL